MARIYDYRLSTPNSDIQIATEDDTSAVPTSYGTYAGYAVEGVSGVYDGAAVTGLIGNGGYEQTSSPYTFDNAIFGSSSQGVGGSDNGFDAEGVAFATTADQYDLQAENGVLLDGVTGTPIGFGDSAFYVDGSQGADTLVGTGPTNYISTATAYGSGDVAVDLTNGYVATGNTLDADLVNINGVALGAQTSSVLGLSSGVDAIYGGSGNDAYYGNGATDYIQGGTGANYVVGGSGDEIFFSGGGDDTMQGGSAANYMEGGTSSGDSDTFLGRGGADYVYGEGGTITLYGSSGQEYLTGGSGFNELIGSNSSAGFNVLEGDTQSSSGTDLFYGGVGTNVMDEGAGTDVFAGGAGTDYIYGGTGRSFVYGGSGTDVVTTGAGDQYFSAGSGQAVFNDTAADLTAGRYDQIDNFSGARAADIYMPSSVANATSFVDQNGGTAVLTATGGGTAEIFVSNTNSATVAAHTHFTLSS